MSVECSIHGPAHEPYECDTEALVVAGEGFMFERLYGGKIKITFDDIDPYMGGSLTLEWHEWKSIVNRLD